MGLGEFDDGGQAKVLAALASSSASAAWRRNCGGYVDALECRVGAGPGYADVAGDALLLRRGGAGRIPKLAGWAASRRAENRWPLKTGMLTLAAMLSYSAGTVAFDVGEESTDRDDGDGGAREILFGVEEFVSGVAREFQAGQFGAIGDGLSDQVVGFRGRAGGKRIFHQLIIGGLIGAEGLAELGLRALDGFLGADQQELGFRHVDVGEADIELGFEVVFWLAR